MSTRKYRKNRGLRKFCSCPRRTWNGPTCTHNWHFNFRDQRGSLGTADRNEADVRFAEIVARIKAGTYVKPTTKAPAATAPVTEHATFEVVAKDYRKRWIDRELGTRAQGYHDHVLRFLAGVTVPPGIAFTEKPFHLIIRADITAAIDEKRRPTEKVYRKGEKTWKRMVGGDVAANRLRDYLSGLWNWAIGEGYTDVSPFTRIGGGRSAIRKKPQEHRARRLRDGEEAGLLDQPIG